jgi:hypothetical protein
MWLKTFFLTKTITKMTEFMMIFRHTPNPNVQITPEQMQDIVKQWMDWIGGIAAQGKFVSTNQLGREGKILHHNGLITDGPYIELKEMMNGYLIVKTDSIDDAIRLAEGCPVLFLGGNVEVRDIVKR